MLLALIHNGVIEQTIYEGNTLHIVDAQIWVQAYAGWTFDGGYELVAVVEPEVPAGWIVASTDYQMINDVPTAVYTFATLTEHQAAKAGNLAYKRWTVETGGIVVNGNPIATDDISQGKVVAVGWLLDHDPTTTMINWEGAPDQWIDADAATMTAIGIAVGRHVQACFTHQRALALAISGATTIEEVVAIDIDAGWPPNA